MITRGDCIYERLEKDEIYICHLCKEQILSDLYGIYKGVIADTGQQIGVMKHKEEGLPTPQKRKRFYMIIFHGACFEKMAGKEFTFVEGAPEAPANRSIKEGELPPKNTMAGKRFA